MIKVNVEIVTGFLGAGKTMFINSLIKESQVNREKILVIQLEEGINKIIKSNDFKYPLQTVNIKDVNELKEEMIYLIEKHKPNRIIVEFNGTLDFNELNDIFRESVYKKISKITTIYFIADGRTLTNYINNMKNFLVPFIQSSNMIVINNMDYCNKAMVENDIQKLKQLNPKAYLLRVNNKYLLNSSLKNSKVLDNGCIKKLSVKIKNFKI